MFLDKVLHQYNRLEHRKSAPSEIRSRSILKTVSWRILGTLDTILIAWLVSGNTTIAFSIGFIELLTKMLLYYFHERVWNTIPWGK